MTVRLGKAYIQYGPIWLLRFGFIFNPALHISLVLVPTSTFLRSIKSFVMFLFPK